MGRPATGTTPVRNLRVPDEIWNVALENAKAEGRTLTEVITGCLKRYNAAAARKHRQGEPEGDEIQGETVPELVDLFRRPRMTPPADEASS